MRRYDVETGLLPEAEAALKARIGVRVEGGKIVFFLGDLVIAELTVEGVLRGLEPNVMELGDWENYLHKIITANIIIPSRPDTKENVRPVNPTDLPPLPDVIEYERIGGKRGREVGFDSETAPDMVKTPEGDIDLKALIALLILHVKKLEEELARPTRA